jgi:hypothetical protein
MLIFRTQFPISSSSTNQEIILIVKQWLELSEHYKIKESLQNIQIQPQDSEISCEGETLKFNFFSDLNLEILGVKFVYQENENEQWVTQLIANKQESSFHVSIELDYNSKYPSHTVPHPNKPYLIKTILQQCPDGNDGILSTNGKPLYLKNSEIDKAVSLITGNGSNIMPILYVSANDNDEHNINPVKLAELLYGMAHVVVEPNRKFSFQLREKSNYQNAYKGSVGIYWSGGLGKQIISPLETRKPINEIFHLIRKALLAQNLEETLTWGNLKNKKNSFQLQELKKDGEKNLQEYVDLLDSDLSAKDNQIKVLKEEITKLKETLKLQNLSSPAQKEENFLSKGTEDELYSGEFNDGIMKILRREFDNAEINSRKKKVLESVINANPEIGKLDEFKTKIRKVLSEAWSSKVEKELVAIGITVKSDGGHHKLYFKNHFFSSVSNTPHKGGRSILNNASDAVKNLFGF